MSKAHMAAHKRAAQGDSGFVQPSLKELCIQWKEAYALDDCDELALDRLSAQILAAPVRSTEDLAALVMISESVGDGCGWNSRFADRLCEIALSFLNTPPPAVPTAEDLARRWFHACASFEGRSRAASWKTEVEADRAFDSLTEILDALTETPARSLMDLAGKAAVLTFDGDMGVNARLNASLEWDALAFLGLKRIRCAA